MSKRIAIILSGCGHRDGSEITEVVSTLIALSELGARVSLFAPDLKSPVTDHRTGARTSETRSSLSEAARIARGKIEDISQLRVDEFDALVLPGGYGAATLLPQSTATLDAIRQFHAQEKPIGAWCIAPLVLAQTLGRKGLTLTIGDHAATAEELAALGAHHEKCAADDFVTDREHKVVTTPAYMYDAASPSAVFKGIRGACKEIYEMA